MDKDLPGNYSFVNVVIGAVCHHSPYGVSDGWPSQGLWSKCALRSSSSGIGAPIKLW